MQKPIDVALSYHAKGYSVIPISPSTDEEKAKKPLIESWKPYQDKQSTEQEIKDWWKRYPTAMIAGVTGKKWDFIAVDADTPEAINVIEGLIPDTLEVPTVLTPRNGRHYHFKYSNGFNNRSKGLLHVRTDGAYIILPPSINDAKKGYSWLVEGDPPEIPEALMSYIKDSYSYRDENQRQQLTTTTTTDNTILQAGRRDDDLFHAANCLIKGGMNYNNTFQVINILAKNCNPPFPESEIAIKIESALKRAERRERNITQDIRDWVMTTNGIFSTTNCYNGQQVTTREEKKAVVVALGRLVEEGVLERIPPKNGVFRRKEIEIEEINWENCDDTIINVKWPFGLERFFICLPKNVIVIAGSQNAGKTAFCLNFAMMNMDTHKINYFSSEMGALELKTRLKKFPISLSKWKKIRFVERSLNFADIIDPDGINIIDYIEVPEEAWKIALPINEIFRKLNNGIALIALQKPSSRDVARGGESTLDRPRLYLSMGGNQLKITKCKNWSDEMDSQGINPNGLSCSYKIVQGCNFIQVEEWNRSGVNLMPPQREARKDWTQSEF